ncbi:phosphoribosyltransferase-like protein [Agrobacterium tumefaciens]|uniref:phosphoribosyltransferase-like protein n=1 Tax=Agrobacterium tumefaciens TaxID=358 RepID=UPI00278038D0|nr:hypothetical protein [Agrobacterium tumefaciens]MDP9855299.1 hypothetical protein [Agrobacterium tumefaciens]
MTLDIATIPIEWDFPDEDSPLEEGAASLLHFLSAKVFCDYEPAQFEPFEARLIRWLNNVDANHDKQRLLSLLLDVFFVGRKEFEALYRSAYRIVIFRWLLEVHTLNPFEDGLEENVHELANKAWICPITDSLRINSFLKVNGLKSRDKRPDWRSMAEFGDPEKIRNYISTEKITDIILLEDFVGSGTQAISSVEFAAKEFPQQNILLCPLVTCPDGDRNIRKALEKYSNAWFDPVLSLPESTMHSYDKFKNGFGTSDDAFLVSLNGKLGYKQDKSAFGFKQTGAKVVMYSNCPNNTLPLFHREAASWAPLFPRVERE